MLRTRSLLIPLVAVLTVACDAAVDDAEMGGEAAPATEMTVAADAAAIEAEVAQIREAWIEAAKAGDAATIAALYTEDARMVSADGTSEGRQAIQEALADGIGMLEDLQVNSTDVVVGTDVVSDMGSYTQTIQTPDGEQTVTGQYVVVLERQDDRSWKIVHHLSAPEAPAAADAPTGEM